MESPVRSNDRSVHGIYGPKESQFAGLRQESFSFGSSIDLENRSVPGKSQGELYSVVAVGGIITWEDAYEHHESSAFRLA